MRYCVGRPLFVAEKIRFAPGWGGGFCPADSARRPAPAKRIGCRFSIPDLRAAARCAITRVAIAKPCDANLFSPNKTGIAALGCTRLLNGPSQDRAIIMSATPIDQHIRGLGAKRRIPEMPPTTRGTRRRCKPAANPAKGPDWLTSGRRKNYEKKTEKKHRAHNHLRCVIPPILSWAVFLH